LIFHLIGSDVIKVVPRVHNLGIVLNEMLTMTDHFKEMCQKIYWILRFLRPPFQVRKRFVVSLILLQFGYGGIVYADEVAKEIEYGL
jgi:hypothetical protein